MDKDLEIILLFPLVEVVEGLVHLQREGEETPCQVDAVEAIEEEGEDEEEGLEEGNRYPIFLLLAIS